jgi:hypothetical protein
MQTMYSWATVLTLLSFAACGNGTQPGPGTNGLSGSDAGGAASSPQPSGSTGDSSAPPPSGTGANNGKNTGGPDTGSPPSSGTPSTGMDAAASLPDSAPASTDAAASTSDALASADGAACTCDRGCLLGFMSGYLNALAAQDPTKIKTASTLKYTENGAVVQLGDGLWKTASALVPDERLDFADPTVGQVASQLVVNENGTTPVIYMARLKVVCGEITEIETMAVRQGDAANGFFQPQNMKPQPVFTQAIDPSMRMTRDQLTSLMNDYLDYLDGMKTGSMVAFDTNCARYENGVATATGLASFTAQSWSFSVVRRILILDEEAGIVWGMFPFQMTDPALVVGEAFKMINGQIMMIQAVMANMPTSAWN